MVEQKVDNKNRIVNHFLQKENFKYKVYGVNLRQSFTLKEIKKTDELNQFDRLVYKVIKSKAFLGM